MPCYVEWPEDIKRRADEKKARRIYFDASSIVGEQIKNTEKILHPNGDVSIVPTLCALCKVLTKRQIELIGASEWWREHTKIDLMQ